MALCSHCGQERGVPLSAHLGAKGFIYLEHCELMAIYWEKIVPCVGASVYRQCNLCKLGSTLGTWTKTRTGSSFVPKTPNLRETKEQ